MPSCNFWIAVTTFFGTPHFFSKRNHRTCLSTASNAFFWDRRIEERLPNHFRSYYGNIPGLVVQPKDRLQIHVRVGIRPASQVLVCQIDLSVFCWATRHESWMKYWEGQYHANYPILTCAFSFVHGDKHRVQPRRRHFLSFPKSLNCLCH